MAISLGTATLSKMYLGVSEITKAYLGATQIFGGTTVDTYAANGISPEFVADFANNYYRVASNDSTFASALTFSRSGNATMVDSDGLIKWAPHNKIIESENLLLWGNSGPVSSGALDRNGGNSAFRIQSTGQVVNVYRTGVNFVVGERYTVEVWAKKEPGTDTLGFYIGSGAPTIELSSESWTFYSISFVATGTSNPAFFEGGSPTIDTLVHEPRIYRSDLGGMVNNPDTGNSYVPTTGTARYLPRTGHHVYNGTSWVNEGVLIESESRVNLFDYSEDFSTWLTQNSVTVTANSAISPDGGLSMSKLIADSNNGGIYKSTGLSVDLGNNLQIVSLIDGSISAPTVGVFDSIGAIDCGNGFYRIYASKEGVTCSVYAKSAEWSYIAVQLYQEKFYIYPAESSSSRGIADGVSGIYIWGAQAEQASTPSSYIPTSGSTVTRAAEVLTVPAANVTAGQTAYSIAIDAYILANASVAPDPLGWFGTNSNLYRHEYRGTSMLVNQRLGAGVNNNNFLLISNNYKIASRGSATENQTAANGTAADVDAQSGTPALNGQNIQLGQHGGSFDTLQIIKSLILWDDDIGTAGIEEASS